MRATTATRTGCVQRGMGQTTPFSGRDSRNAAEDDPRPSILQLNTEGLTDNKISIIEQLAYKKKSFIIVLHETHCTTADKLVIPNFSLAGSILSRNHGLATFVHERLEWSLVDQSPDQSETKWLCVDVAGYKIVNLYKLPRSRLTPTTIPTFPHPSLYVGDFNCQHVNWGYNIPQRWEPGLLGNIQQPWTVVQPKGNSQFLLSPLERRHQPMADQAFASFGQDSRLPDRRVLKKFPRLQHSPSLITPARFKVPSHSDPAKCWNFHKADWKRFCLLTGESVERLPPSDAPDIERAYQVFC